MKNQNTKIKILVMVGVILGCFIIKTPLVGAATSVIATSTEVFATASDGTPLHWIKYTPNTPGPWPAVLVIHGGGFVKGDDGGGTGSLFVQTAIDLASAGMIAFSIEYRLAPPGSIQGQTSDGRYPDQTNDVKLAVLKARTYSNTTGQVGAVGGSGGASHAAYVAASGTPGQDKIDVGVVISGSYDFSDALSIQQSPPFYNKVTNYVNSTDLAVLHAASPVAFVDSTVSPLLLVHSTDESMPFPQLAAMQAKLDSVGATNYQTIVFQGRVHSFANWTNIKDQALTFLAAGFAKPPSAPQNLSVGTISSSTINIFWNPPLNDYGSPVTSYFVEYIDASSTTATSTLSVATTSATVTGLSASTVYMFQVSAINGNGTSTSATTTGQTLANDTNTVPTAPTSLSAIGGDSLVSLTWAAPSSDGGSPITDYVIEYKISSDQTWLVFNDGVSVTTAGTVSGLQNNTSYDFRVSAVNAIGTSAPSNVVSATPVPTVVYTVPGAPTSLTATPGNANTALSWIAPTDNGGTPITDYIVEYHTALTNWSVFNDGTSTATNATVTNLVNGTSYEFRVSAVNIVGTSAPSVTVRSKPRKSISLNVLSGSDFMASLNGMASFLGALLGVVFPTFS